MLELSHYKAAICTSSIYGYALRKIIEATACGCVVISDLPEDECLPRIDGNIIRIEPDTSTHAVADILDRIYDTYDPHLQAYYAEAACEWYDYRLVGARLANDIEAMRSTYNANAR